jgi:hypothetical protein
MRPKILLATDRAMGAILVALLLGSVICFGGDVWWFRPWFAALVFSLSVAMLIRLLARGQAELLKSPLGLLGLLAVLLGFFQLIPLPPRVAGKISPAAQAIYTTGVWPRLLEADDPSAVVPDPAQARSPATLDRAATLRWLVSAVLCLAIFWVVSSYADRLGRMYLVSGCVVAAFLLNGAIGLVQVAGRADGLFGFLVPGHPPLWAPSLDDLLSSPTTARLQLVGDAQVAGAIRSKTSLDRVALVPDRPYLFGTMMGGPGGFLALGSLALPLALAIGLHLISPRGSRESFTDRLAHSGKAGLVWLLAVSLVIASFLVGLMAGPWYSAPFVLGVLTVGFLGLFVRGSRLASITWSALLLVFLGMGVSLGTQWDRIVGGPAPIEPISWEAARLTWTESLRLIREFPLVGAGFGTFATVHPYLKTHDAFSTTAMSSLIQCGVESGFVGLAILGLAVLWSLARVPVCLARVGSADRMLAYGLLGAGAGFSLWFVMHWSIELPAVAVAASALGGIWNRWLAGGTDVFVERVSG